MGDLQVGAAKDAGQNYFLKTIDIQRENGYSSTRLSSWKHDREASLIRLPRRMARFHPKRHSLSARQGSEVGKGFRALFRFPLFLVAGIAPHQNLVAEIAFCSSDLFLWQEFHFVCSAPFAVNEQNGIPATGWGESQAGGESPRRERASAGGEPQEGGESSGPGSPEPLGVSGGDDRIRTGDKGFAGLCLTTWPRRQGLRLT